MNHTKAITLRGAFEFQMKLARRKGMKLIEADKALKKEPNEKCLSRAKTEVSHLEK